jgi:signal peptidase I
MIRRATLVVVALAIAFVSIVCYAVIRFTVVRVDSIAMEPTIPHGSLVLVDRFAYRGDRARRGDIVAYTSSAELGGLFVQRVVAVSGDDFSIRGGRIFLNGKPVSQSPASFPKYDFFIRDYDIHVNGKPLGESDVLAFSDWTTPHTVPPGCYIVLGDNRNRSVDSHVAGFMCPNRPGLLDVHGVTQLVGRVER